MSATTLKLPFKRFVAQVSTGSPRPKSSYLALMAENVDALQACPWREAADVPASLTGHDFTAATQFSDAYDAFKLSGNYDSSAMTEVAYAGMSAYRFTIPASAISGSVPVTGVSLPIARDRFEAAGVHVAVALSSSASPSDDWSVVRGSGALAASAQLTQTAAYLTDGSPANGMVALDLSGVTVGNPATYLWVYITLEDYTSHWTMYNSKEQRLYAVEGSAMLIGDSADVSFGADVTQDAPADALPIVAGGVLPRLMGETSGIFATVRRGNGDGVAFEGAPPEETGADGGMGLHSLYADLLLGRLHSVPTSAMPGDTRPGVGFSIARGTMSVPGDTPGTDVVAPVWQLALSVLVVPFVRPGGRFSSLSLAWTAPSPASGTIRAYLAPGKYIEKPEAAELSAAAFFTGDDPPDGWRPLGEFSAAAESATLALPAPPPVPQLATLLLAAWLPQSSVDPSYTSAQGVGSLAYDPFACELSGLSSLVVPTITLI